MTENNGYAVKYAQPPKKYGDNFKSVNVYQPVDNANYNDHNYQWRAQRPAYVSPTEDDELAMLEAMMN